MASIKGGKSAGQLPAKSSGASKKGMTPKTQFPKAAAKGKGKGGGGRGC